MGTRIRVYPILVLLLLTAWAGHSHAVVHNYTETFTSTQYEDGVNTTAYWDTSSGSVRLFPFTPLLVGSHSTPTFPKRVTAWGNNEAVFSTVIGPLSNIRMGLQQPIYFIAASVKCVHAVLGYGKSKLASQLSAGHR